MFCSLIGFALLIHQEVQDESLSIVGILFLSLGVHIPASLYSNTNFKEKKSLAKILSVLSILMLIIYILVVIT